MEMKHKATKQSKGMKNGVWQHFPLIFGCINIEWNQKIEPSRKCEWENGTDQKMGGSSFCLFLCNPHFFMYAIYPIPSLNGSYFVKDEWASCAGSDSTATARL